MKLSSRQCIFSLVILFVGLSALQLTVAETPLNWWSPNALEQNIIWDIRIPRTVLTWVIAIALGFAGAVMQLLLRNPLAEPGITGVSGCAALVTIACLYFGWLPAYSFGLPALALVGGLTGVGLLMLLAGERASPTRVILAGVAIATMSSAGMGLLLYLAPNPFAFQEWAFWHMGSLANKSWHSVLLALPGVALAVPLIWFGRRFLYALTLSEETVETMGFNVARYRNLMLLAVALLTTASVVAAGVIGFVGLLAPHAVRLLGFNHPKYVLWLSPLTSVLLLVSFDTLAQLVSTARELPVGVLAALVGAPLLIVLLMRERGRHA
ncbi:iron complex transport system permease protein [Idiomarina fontislapidosi]|uniref:ABC transporter permease n=1 Tax=Idiomarina fontislapidosi TaxID=263723 RepID=A0A432XWW9_9GAMM|nr:iron ABC transporter permease [Idiomarina fontislapidosi]PYE32011.1 iron complex transport system permease protein [Idiomarina fontislapidosi]RUO53220.1 ABC transporter permease [Idiomarina fontislapidosi]